MITRIIPHRKISLCSLLLALLAPVLLTAGCNDTQENEGARDPTTPLPEPKPKPKTYPLVITDIRNLPPKTTFAPDRGPNHGCRLEYHRHGRGSVYGKGKISNSKKQINTP